MKVLFGISSDIQTSKTLLLVCYTDRSVAEIKKEVIFRNSWLGLGGSGQWKEPGDYKTLNLLLILVIIIRDKSNNLHAYSNSFRHRGSLIQDGNGNVKSIICPFHGWAHIIWLDHFRGLQ